MRLVWGQVVSVESQAEEIQRLSVACDDGLLGVALCYPALSGLCESGDRVLLNTTAVDMGLGTGGTHFVVVRLSSDSSDSATGVAFERSSGGHIMKLRYTPLQFDVCAVEEQMSPHHIVMSSAEDLAGMPVVCCGLHSQVPLVAAAAKQVDSALRIAYVMTDSGALPLALSEIVRESVAAGLIDSTITSGHAFGGMYESVNLHSALLAARHVARADAAIVAIGPGVVGTATPFGHGGVAQGEAVNAVASLGGVPIAALRLSIADARPRHQGVSHHTITALTRVALVQAIVAVPHLPHVFAEAVEARLAEAGVWERHTCVTISPGPASSPDLKGVQVTTMGRTADDDPVFFAAAYAAGETCARIALGEIV